MQQDLQITFRDIEPSEAVETRIRGRVEKLEEFHDRITSCHVTVSAPHRHHHQGKLYQVHIEILVPGGSVVTSRDHGEKHAHEDVYIAIRDSFDVAQRQLQDFVRKQKK